MKLRKAQDSDISTLLRWFPDEASVRIWGGPDFRFPTSNEMFREDCRWGDIPSYCLDDEGGTLIGFGQAYRRLDRAHLARIVVGPNARSRGAGSALVEAISNAALQDLQCRENSLYVLPDNLAARKCYDKAGYREMPVAESIPFPVVFMVRPEPILRGPD